VEVSVIFGSLFKNYGAKAEITFSPMTVFIKIFKKEGFE
jgi:hypothetical protein